MVGCHHGLSGHESEQAPEDILGMPREPGICSPQGCRVRHDLVTEQQEDTFENPFKALGEARVSCELNSVHLVPKWLGSILITHSRMEVPPSGSL